MVSDQLIAESLDSLLRGSSPNSFTTFNCVVEQLESKLGIDLSPKLALISTQIQLFYALQQLPPPSQEQKIQQKLSKDDFTHNQNPNPAIDYPEPFQHSISEPKQDYNDTSSIQNLNFAVNFSKFVQPTSLISKPEYNNIAASEIAKQSAIIGTKRRGGPGGLNKLCGVSPELQPIVGQSSLPRTEIVRQLWAYIRKNNLQDPGNKRKINCNDELRVVFETDCTDMFKMNKLLSKHIIPLEPSKGTGQHCKKRKADVLPAIKGTKSSPSVIISEVLAKFFGIDRREMLQSEILDRIWGYIKVNHLEDPLEPMRVLCDPKLREVLGCESISSLGIPETLARHHLFKIS